MHFRADASHEARDDAPPADAVEHSDFLGDADWIITAGQRITEETQLRVFRLPGERRSGERHARVNAGRRLVVLVQHDVEAKLVSVDVIVEITVVEISRYARIQKGVW